MSSGGPQRASTIVFHLSLALFLVSFVLVAVYAVNKEMTGLSRSEAPEEGSTGLYHATSAAATASLGLVVLVGARLLWAWPWTRWLLLPGLVFHSIVAVLAASRMALFVTGVMLVVMICVLLDRRCLAAIVL